MTPKPKLDPSRVRHIIDRILFYIIAALVIIELGMIAWMILQYKGVIG
jgi:TRAP-type C4-dicarboxylate transport system permease small subunit